MHPLWPAAELRDSEETEMKAAVIEGCYVDLKFMPGLKSSRISIDIPIEYSNEFLKMFDAPDRANPVRVAIARLTTTVAEPLPAPEGAATHEVEKARTPFSKLCRSKQAALKCDDPEFQKWIGAESAEHVKFIIYAICDIQSRAALDDPENPNAIKAFDRLLTDFSVRGLAR